LNTAAVHFRAGVAFTLFRSAHILISLNQLPAPLGDKGGMKLRITSYCGLLIFKQQKVDIKEYACTVETSLKMERMLFLEQYYYK
jgi:hypothetical protein